MGQYDGALSAEEAILMSDLVLVEALTMELRAVLQSMPVICLGFVDYVK